jgi:hypothetical protein
MDEALCPLDYDAPAPQGGVILDDDLASQLRFYLYNILE